MRRLEAGRLVLATHNKGKVDEIAALLAPCDIETVSAAALGLPEPPETESTFVGNARLKAHAAASASGLPALSDDSGIMIDALDGAPGVFTADWATTAKGRDYGLAMSRAWMELEAISAPFPRRARFCATLCLAWPDGVDRVFEGSVPGHLVWPPRGDKGFGFDPMFVPDGYDLTFAEMEPEKKHAISHRAVAFARFVEGALGR